jgi:hypothetical protein
MRLSSRLNRPAQSLCSSDPSTKWWTTFQALQVGQVMQRKRNDGTDTQQLQDKSSRDSGILSSPQGSHVSGVMLGLHVCCLMYVGARRPLTWQHNHNHPPCLTRARRQAIIDFHSKPWIWCLLVPILRHQVFLPQSSTGPSRGHLAQLARGPEVSPRWHKVINPKLRPPA